MAPLAGYRSPRSLVQSGKLTTPEIFEWNARENPGHPLYQFHDGQKINTITFAQAIQGIRRAARYVKSRVPTPEIIAIVANADTITYSVTSIGILRAGYIAFVISPRNVPAAVADMLRRTNCRHMLVSQDAPIQSLAETVLKEVPEVTSHPMPKFEDLFPSDAPTQVGEPDDLPKEFDVNAVALIMHSSGSTNHPKPIRWTHKRMVAWTCSLWYGEIDPTQASLSIHSTPMFHAIGVLMYCLGGNHGMPLLCFPPSSPPTFPTPENIFEGIVKTSADFIMTAPAIIEIWARDPKKVQHMKTMRGVIFGGAPLDQEVGDTLASQGVTLYSCYGSTEIGANSRFWPANPGMDWAYFQINPMHEAVFVDAGEGRSELIMLSPPDMPLPILNRKIGNRDAYATNDVLEPHPTRPGFWKYYGRLDDQIILSNAEKTNPGPLESIIAEDPLVQASLMFGQGKSQNGVLVEPKQDYKFDPQDTEKLLDFRNKIWKTIERANAFAPQHSRIFKEMIIVTSPAKPFTYNIKGYPRRATVLKEYENEIAAAYAAIEESAQSDIPAPTAWDEEKTHAFLRAVVEKVLKKSIADDADFFRNGCDSLQATWIRNTILRAVREQSPAAAKGLHMNVVFQAPTISALTDAVLHVVRNDAPAPAARTTADDLARIAERYSAELPARPSQLRARASTKDVVLVTGTTGGFGCDVLEHLLRDEGVAKVYAFNRHGSNALERQRARFRERGLEEGLLDSPKFTMVEAVLDVPGFGLDPVLLNEVRGSITHILHNAWTVNFVLSLPSFEADLKTVRNLVELSLSSPHSEPPRIQLASSIGIFEHCTVQPPVPEVPIDASSALGSGYSESKWVAERVLYNVAERAGVPAVVVRLGQISGDKTGHWNEREWFPALVKSAVFTRCLPDVEGNVSFFLGYTGARAFVEMRDSPERILHLVHPRPVSWHTLIAPIAAELGVPLVPYATWLTALEQSGNADDGGEAVQENPALRLLDYFRERTSADEGREPLGLPYLATEKAERVSKTLAGMPQLGEAEARRWVAAWRASGFLTDAKN